MDDRKPNSWIDRENRRGCFIILGVLILIIAALAYVGLRGEPMNAVETNIPVQP